jgi:hypothetical protein
MTQLKNITEYIEEKNIPDALKKLQQMAKQFGKLKIAEISKILPRKNFSQMRQQESTVSADKKQTTMENSPCVPRG